MSGHVPESAARRRAVVRRLVLVGFAAAGSAVFAAGTAAAANDEPASTGLLPLGEHARTLGGALTEADSPALDAVLGDVDVAEVSSAIVDVESVSGLGLITMGDAETDPAGTGSAGAEAGAGRGDHSTDGSKADATPQRSDASGPGGPTADPEDIGRDSDPEHAEDSRRTGPGASGDIVRSASAAVSHADALGELAGGLSDTVRGTVSTVTPVLDTAEAVAAFVLSAADPVVTATVSMLQPALQTVRPVVDTALAVTAPVVRPLAPVLTTVVPVLDTVTPVLGTMAPITDVIGPAVGGLLPAPAGPVLAAAGPRPASLGGATAAATPPPALTPGVEAITLGGSTAPQVSLEAADQPRVIAVQVPEGERPNPLSTPLAGLPGLSLGALSAAASADQTVPTSSALLPEEAAQRARFVSAAARASGVDGWSQREATRPSVSPD